MNDKKLDLMRRIKNGESFEKCSQEDSDFIEELEDDGLVNGLDVKAYKEDKGPMFGWIDVKMTLKGQEEFERLRNKLKAFFKNNCVSGIITGLVLLAFGAVVTSVTNNFNDKKEKPSTVGVECTNKFEDAENVVTNLVERDNINTNNLEIKGVDDDKK